MKKILLVFASILVIVAIWQIYPTEARKLRKDIARMERAVEGENADGIINHIDPSYKDSSGMTYDEINQRITEFFAQVDSINIQMHSMKLRIDSVDRGRVTFASCSLGLRVLARYEGERVLVFGGVVHPASVRALFRKTGNRYLLYHAEY